MIGVVGAGGDELRDALRSAGASAELRSPDRVDGCDLVVAVGVDALAELVAADVHAHILPVDCSLGPLGTGPDGAIDAADRLAAGDVRVTHHRRVGVTVDGERYCSGLLDVVLRTEEPARISEYTVAIGDRVDRFRADGVAVATPLGSPGYARAAGGPVIDPDADCFAVVPIAAFALGANRHVVPIDRVLTITVERDEAVVAVDVDGRAAGSVPPGAPVRISTRGTVGIAVLRGDGTETL